MRVCFTKLKVICFLLAITAVNAHSQRIPPLVTIYYLKSKLGLATCESEVSTAITDAELDAQLARLRGNFQRSEVRNPGTECPDKLRVELRREYDQVQAGLKSDAAKAALKEHYVLIRKSLDDLGSIVGATSTTFERRSDQNNRRANEQWQRFLVEVE
jgi:hypothetical protein